MDINFGQRPRGPPQFPPTRGNALGPPALNIGGLQAPLPRGPAKSATVLTGPPMAVNGDGLASTNRSLPFRQQLSNKMANGFLPGSANGFQCQTISASASVPNITSKFQLSEAYSGQPQTSESSNSLGLQPTFVTQQPPQLNASKLGAGMSALNQDPTHQLNLGSQQSRPVYPAPPPTPYISQIPPPPRPIQTSTCSTPSFRSFGPPPPSVPSFPSMPPSASLTSPPPATTSSSALKSPLAQRYPTTMPPTVTPGSSIPPAASSYGGQPPPPAFSAACGGRPPVSAAGLPPQPPPPAINLSQSMGGLSLGQGADCLDLLQNRHILPPKPVPPPKFKLQAELWNTLNCSPDIFRSTLTKVPETDSLLKKSRLPLGILLHPFRDLSHLPVIQCATIVRCRQCRTYVNPFVHFVDQRRWRCNVCYRVNELPEEFLYDPVSKSFGDPSRRPECKASTIEFIAPSEYMLRPPQPAVYLFLLDVSRQAVESGYVKIFCDTLLDELDKLPGDGRTQVAFITYDKSVHFYCLPEGASQPTQLTVCDVDDVFLPSPSDLLVNLQEMKVLIQQLLEELPHMVSTGHSTESSLGAALQAAFKMASPTGGRISVFQHILPTVGPGSLSNRESAGDAKKVDSSLLGPAKDFYKKLSLDCSGQQIAVDLFAMGSQYIDVATLSGMSKFSAGQVQHFPGYHVVHNTAQAAKFENALRRYLTRKIGFEAVMRIRCTRGLALHTFHGNFFVRSTDLLSLPNVNPDAGFGIQVTIEDDLRDSREVTFQAALLYTSSRGERRIRVHTMCLPTCATVSEVINGADQMAIVGMLTKFAADRATNDSKADAKEGLVVSCVDAAETYKNYASMSVPNGLVMPKSLKLLPLYVLACLRTAGFRNGVRMDEMSIAFSDFKSLPLFQLIKAVYPDLYRVDDLSDEDDNALVDEADDSDQKIRVPQPPLLQLSFEGISATGMYLLDVGDMFYLYLSRGLHQYSLEMILGVSRLNQVDETMTGLPELENPESEKLRTFVNWLNGHKPYHAPVKIIREDGKQRHLFVERMVDDRFEGSYSYFEFLQHLRRQMKSN